LSVRDLTVAYKVRNGEVLAVQDVSFDIHRGESFGLVGESGCGKSTVAWSIVNFLGANGFVKRGSINFLGQKLVGTTGEALRRLRGDRIAMVYQDPMQALNPSMRLGDQMKEALTVHRGLTNKRAEARCISMLERVHMADPADVMRRFPHQVSGGQQQRVVIAMALLNSPALLILDEPTTALDVTVEAAVLDLIAELRRDSDTAILFISHNLGVVSRVCNRVGVMYAGEMVEHTDVHSLFAAPQHPYTQGLMRCVPRLGNDRSAKDLYPIPGRVPAPGQRPTGCVYAPRCDYARDLCRAEHPPLRQLSDQSFVRCLFSEEIDGAAWTPPDGPSAPQVAPVTPNDKPILIVDSLRKTYRVPGNTLADVIGLGEKKFVNAVSNISFSVAKGSTLGIVGESGCGKSTLVRTLIGLEQSSSGTAEFIGFDITGSLDRRDAEIIRSMQMVFQNPDSTMNPSYTVGQQIARPMVRFGTVPRHQIRSEVLRLLHAMRLDESYYDRLPRQLSGGEKQRVGIARTLASRPDLILCDEPVSALDVSVQAAILNLLSEVRQESGATMLFIAHDLSVVRSICDSVAVMYLGEFVEIGPVEAIYTPPHHPYTEALLSAVPIPDPAVPQTRIRLQGNVPSAMNPPTGCRFHTRCPRRSLLPNGGEICTTEAPPWRLAGEGHQIACHIPVDLLLSLDATLLASPTPNGQDSESPSAHRH
jgi:peptide/nickel transport system ATP-binding protein